MEINKDLIIEGTNKSLSELNTELINLDNKRQGTILWENPNPSAAFADQIINITTNGYNWIEYYYRSSCTDPLTMFQKAPAGVGTILISIMSDGTIRRRIIYDSGTSITTIKATTTGQCVPTYIIGYKN